MIISSGILAYRKKVLSVILLLVLPLMFFSACRNGVKTITGYIYFDGSLLQVDEVEIITSDDTARIAALGLSVDNDFPNGYSIYNESDAVTTYKLNSNTVYSFTDLGLNFVDKENSTRFYSTNLKEEFLKCSAYSTKSADKIPYFIKVNGKKVLSITEEFLYTQ